MLAAILLAVPQTASARHSLRTGFTDDSVFRGGAPGDRLAGFAHARAARGSVVRVFFSWAELAPTPPPSGAVARNPAWPGYRWGTWTGSRAKRTRPV